MLPFINGSNDPYWATDALNLYWDDLKGDKWILYVPNAGHNLQQKTAKGPDYSRVIGGVAAFVRHQVSGRPLPRHLPAEMRFPGLDRTAPARFPWPG